MKNQKGNPNQIKPNELRIGNLILFRGKALEAATIGTDFCMLSDGTITYDAWYDEMRPIPLTEEMLLKLGFEHVDSGHSEDHEDFHEWLEKDYPTLGCVYSGDGDYVFCEKFDDQRIYDLHQLQNLHFALTGEELKIEL